jgi:uncharacterized membrane protein
MKRWIKIVICSVVLVVFALVEWLTPSPTPPGWPKLIQGLFVTLMPFAAIYLLVILINMLGEMMHRASRQAK